jgi:hypothetical protein
MYPIPVSRTWAHPECGTGTSSLVHPSIELSFDNLNRAEYQIHKNDIVVPLS